MERLDRDEKLERAMRAGPVIPVLTIDDVAHAVPLARALVAGGLPAIEITLRTKPALAAIEAVAREVEGAIVGAGTVLNREQLRDAQRAGATFAVSPGATPALLEAADVADMGLLPGVATASEAMVAQEAGYRFLKFFPAEASGGIHFLKSIYGPLPELRFCPTGGIDAAKARDYLALPNVLCVGGSWVVPMASIKAGDFAMITHLARDACALRS
ncbi:MAG: bifunctional 4-hydroxy-2-oxoglutarate aldolase/2-dehydro-3-deoxy-phosphogluconate aldolase [Beijerinckiaceae bacterium]|nr:bifunctional 4-hydroxy-2-oxoglutarate aldolase/2-dehydro-3-deoxy-phosphogluconate aldolase [Beijerinckiaceae bacterium]